MAINGIPRNEKVWLQRTVEDGTVYYITSKQFDESTYFLYKMVDGAAKKLGKSANPIVLERKYIDKGE